MVARGKKYFGNWERYWQIQNRSSLIPAVSRWKGAGSIIPDSLLQKLYKGREEIRRLPWVSYLRTAQNYLGGRCPHWNTESAAIPWLWRTASALWGSADGDLEKNPKLGYTAGTVSGNRGSTRYQHVWTNILETFAHDMISTCFAKCLWRRLEWRLSAASCFRAYLP